MEIDLVDVFTFGGTGGNPCPVVVDASGLDARAMQEVAARCGHESAFVLPPPSGDYDTLSASSCHGTRWRCAATRRSARSGSSTDAG